MKKIQSESLSQDKLPAVIKQQNSAFLNNDYTGAASRNGRQGREVFGLTGKGVEKNS